MNRQIRSPSPEARDTLRALRRAAKRALELGIQTGTPVWVMKKGKLVDLTKEQSASKKATKTHAASKRAASKRVVAKRAASKKVSK